MNRLNLDISYDYVKYLFNHKPDIFFNLLFVNKGYWGVLSEVLFRKAKDDPEILEFLTNISYIRDNMSYILDNISQNYLLVNYYTLALLLKTGKIDKNNNNWLMRHMAQFPNRFDFGVLNNSNLPISELIDSYKTFISSDNLRFFNYYLPKVTTLENKVSILVYTIYYDNLPMLNIILNTITNSELDQAQEYFGKSLRMYDPHNTNVTIGRTNLDLEPYMFSSYDILHFALTDPRLSYISNSAQIYQQLNLERYISKTIKNANNSREIISPQIVQWLIQQQPHLTNIPYYWYSLIENVTTVYQRHVMPSNPDTGYGYNEDISFTLMPVKQQENRVALMRIFDQYNINKRYGPLIGQCATRSFWRMMLALDQLSTDSHDYITFIRNVTDYKTMEVLLQINRGVFNDDQMLYVFINNYNQYSSNTKQNFYDLIKLIDQYYQGSHNYDRVINQTTQLNDPQLTQLLVDLNKGPADYELGIMLDGNYKVLKILFSNNKGLVNYYKLLLDQINKPGVEYQGDDFIELLMSHKPNNANYNDVINIITQSDRINILRKLIQENTGTHNYDSGVNRNSSTMKMELIQILNDNNRGPHNYTQGINNSDNLEVIKYLLPLNRGSTNYASAINHVLEIYTEQMFRYTRTTYSHVGKSDEQIEKERAAIASNIINILNELLQKNVGVLNITEGINQLRDMNIIRSLIPYNQGQADYDKVLNAMVVQCVLDDIKYLHQYNTQGNHDYLRGIDVAARNNCDEVLQFLLATNQGIAGKDQFRIASLVHLNNIELFRRLITLLPEYRKENPQTNFKDLIHELVKNGQLEKLKIVLLLHKYKVNLNKDMVYILKDSKWNSENNKAIYRLLKQYNPAKPNKELTDLINKGKKIE